MDASSSGAPQIFRNSAAFTALVRFVGFFMMAAALLFPFVAAWKIVHEQESAGQRTKEAVIIVLGCGLVGLFGLGLWAQGDSMKFYEARLEPEGVRFQLGFKKAPKETVIPYASIVAVNYKMPMNTAYASVVTGDGTTVKWSSYEFFRTKTLAKAIAARAGQELQQMP
jgi:tellurite resistance protein TehA-like permease